MIGEKSSYSLLALHVTVDMLRNWERNGLITVPRDPSNGYRMYGPCEVGRIRVIRTLVQAGYSLMAILHMLHQPSFKPSNITPPFDNSSSMPGTRPDL
jgi:DNA-binding transcriptional MerR regulator